ncbi:hypothetical protein AZE42_10077 [Rhizopogon vesiculosus]|uniref:Uncharacterized protein n=1 Tax=Rhizopogon vesiculosus TaxID=180088 RepID=A0A1J8PRM2_9AGAM|nr:hypothetical protein AZE42_10077 [Rhizopogon vesiculosus]
MDAHLPADVDSCDGLNNDIDPALAPSNHSTPSPALTGLGNLAIPQPAQSSELGVLDQYELVILTVNEIKSAMDTGNYASEAVRILDEQRSSMSIPQFHSRLQPKRKWPHVSAAPSPSASDPHGAVHV